jgi:hypothetical protein
MKGILLDETGDLMVRSGGLVIGEVDSQVAEHVLRAYPGEFKEVPLIGAHVGSMVGGTPDPFWRGRAKEMLKTQHVEVKNININGDIITVEL